jgi:murein DD-endopeptidase MepM/ murein hydrolase activator NlpD
MRIRLAPLACLVVVGLAAMLVPGAAQAALFSARNGNLSSFSGGISQVNGTFAPVSDRYGSDTQTFAASYSGSGTSGEAQGTFNVHWHPRQSVAYGAAFYLPPNFHAATQGQQALIRWDTKPGSGGRFFEGGVVVDYSDNAAYLVGATVAGASVSQRVLAGPFSLPVGSWFTLQVRQLLGSGAAAFSEVYENGKLVATSRAPNFPGWQVHHVRYGIVQLSGGAEQGSVSMEFDQATAGTYTGYVNPLGGDRYITGRTDMGVDFCLTPGEPIRAVGDGVVVGISPNWFLHQPYVWYQLIDGPDAGRFVYVAEQINRLPRIGAQIAAGQPIAYYKRAGTCIETGWSAADGATLAQATTGYHEGQVTRAGVQFARFLGSLGLRGPFELVPTHGLIRRHGAPDPAPAS